MVVVSKHYMNWYNLKNQKNFHTSIACMTRINGSCEKDRNMATCRKLTTEVENFSNSSFFNRMRLTADRVPLRLSSGRESVLVTMHEIFQKEYASTPKGHILRCLPTAVIVDSGIEGLRSVTRAFDVVYDSSRKDDPFNCVYWFNEIAAAFNEKADFYLGIELALVDDVWLRFYRVKPQTASSLSQVRVARVQTSLSARSKPVLKALKQLPLAHNFSPSRAGEAFMYRNVKFKVAETELFQVPKEVQERVGPGVWHSTVHMLNENDNIVMSFKDFVCHPFSLDRWFRVTWLPEKDLNYCCYEFAGTDLIGWEVRPRSCVFVRSKPKAIDLKKLAERAHEDHRFGVIDLETYKENDTELVPYAAGARFGGLGNHIRCKEEVSLWYLTDFPGWATEPKQAARFMMEQLAKCLLRVANRGYKIYAHNLANFDGPLLVKYLSHIKGLKIKPFMRGTRTYRVVLTMNIAEMDACWGELNIGPRGGTSKLEENKRLRIVIEDSYLLLPASLKLLGEVFRVQTQKGEFDHMAVKHHNLNYRGIGPNGERDWSRRDECLKYLASDLGCTYEVVQMFEDKMATDYGIDIHRHLTIPSVTLQIFLSNFMSSELVDRLAILTGSCERDIRKAFRGGVTNVLKPLLKEGVVFDENSQYPAAMLNDMPVGIPVYCSKPNLEDGFFGFVQAHITAPKDLKVPFLQAVVNNRTINPLGSWSGWYFSEELKLAVALGYQIETIDGYKFERGRDIFRKFIEHFYRLKAESTNSFDRYVVKLILVSFFGKWGMRDNPTETELMSWAEYGTLETMCHVNNVWVLNPDSGENNVIVEYEKLPDADLLDDDSRFISMLETLDREDSMNRNVAIAAAVTSYARIGMFEKVIATNAAFTATDSVFCDKNNASELDGSIGDGLGQFKKEGEFSEALFIRGGVYYYERLTGNGETKLQCKFGGLRRGTVNSKEPYRALYNGQTVSFTENRIQKIKAGGLREATVKMVFEPPNDNKRRRVFNEKGAWVDTIPLVINNGVVVDTDFKDVVWQSRFTIVYKIKTWRKTGRLFKDLVVRTREEIVTEIEKRRLNQSYLKTPLVFYCGKAGEVVSEVMRLCKDIVVQTREQSVGGLKEYRLSILGLPTVLFCNNNGRISHNLGSVCTDFNIIKPLAVKPVPVEPSGNCESSAAAFTDTKQSSRPHNGINLENPLQSKPNISNLEKPLQSKPNISNLDHILLKGFKFMSSSMLAEPIETFYLLRCLADNTALFHNIRRLLAVKRSFVGKKAKSLTGQTTEANIENKRKVLHRKNEKSDITPAWIRALKTKRNILERKIAKHKEMQADIDRLIAEGSPKNQERIPAVPNRTDKTKNKVEPDTPIKSTIKGVRDKPNKPKPKPKVDNPKKPKSKAMVNKPEKPKVEAKKKTQTTTETEQDKLVQPEPEGGQTRKRKKRTITEPVQETPGKPTPKVKPKKKHLNRSDPDNPKTHPVPRRKRSVPHNKGAGKKTQQNGSS
uniref:DNA-directed DNA polymerase n=1 Tax=Marophrys sp. SRT127 TaxID=2488311 RepID=A0A455RHY8_9EUKA|nr:DNA polymerase [Marophrys sp. SRT127]